MISEERQFPEFAKGVLLGLYRAYLTDVDVFLILSSGLLMGSRSRSLRGLGQSVLAYATFRRFDGYVHVTATQLARLATVKNERISNE